MVDQYNRQMTFVAPSQWIMNQAKMSSTLRNAHVIYQANVHGEFDYEFKIFSQYDFVRPAKQFNIGVASADSSSPLKGSDLIPAILSGLKNEHFKFNLLELFQFPQTQNGYLQFWKEIDCLLVLSRADNSPNVMHEAKIAGVPIIATNVGGIPELIDPVNDFLFNFDENLIEKVSNAIIELAAREYAHPRKSRMQVIKSKSEQPLQALLEAYSFNSSPTLSSE
jgi:glycosyltransferase involved in cell wall biosynthesis